MDWLESILATARALLLPLGLLVPGAALLSAVRLPRTLGTCFVASSALLFLAVVAFAGTHVPISGPTLGAALAAITLACLIIARVRRAPPEEPGTGHEIFAVAWWRELGPWSAFYLIIAAVLATRLVLQPLNGPDVFFRWGWLPEQMLRTGGLDFYPPRSDADFARYFWPEAIPPGVAGLYAWARACWPSPLGASVVVALQILALHEFVFRTGWLIGGRIAARGAVLLVAATPLLNWSLLLGQETGLTALGAVGLALGFLLWRDTRNHRWIVFAGLGAALAASAREYGVAFGFAGALAFAVSRAGWRPIAMFAGVAFAATIAWFGRVAALTGNPLYSLDFLGLPVNPVFSAYVAHTASLHGGTLSSMAGAWELARHLARWALPALVGGLAVALRWRRVGVNARWLAWFALPAVPLWAASVGFTAGGLFYSLRVLAPTLALLAVFAGGAIAQLSGARAQRLVALALGLLILESIPKTLVLPENPYRMPLGDWLTAGNRLNREVANGGAELRRTLAALPARSPILTESAGLERLLASDGVEVRPLWSPAVAWLFDEQLSPPDVAARWQAAGCRIVVLTRGSVGADFLFRRARWRAPWFTLKEIATPGPYLVLEITAAP